MRLLILGDSLSFPRPQKGQPLAATWPALLKAGRSDLDIWLRATPRSCILDVLKEFCFFTDSLPEFEVIIVQTGIVDCAPRPYPRWIYKLIETFLGMPALRRIERFAHQNLLWLYNRPWVGAQQFRQSIGQIVRTVHRGNPCTPVLFIPIASPSRTIVQNLPGIDRAAADYNEILRTELARLGPTYSCECLAPFTGVDPLQVTIEDGHHLSVTGHRLIADAIREGLRSLAPRSVHSPGAVSGTAEESLAGRAVSAA